MGDEFLIRGEWVSGHRARLKLERAAAVLELSSVELDRAMARWVRRDWRPVAARPTDSARILERAAELELGPRERPSPWYWTATR